MPRGDRVAKFTLTLVRLVVHDGKRIAFDDVEKLVVDYSIELATAAMFAGGPASAVIP
jgi:hypothetical protein